MSPEEPSPPDQPSGPPAEAPEASAADGPARVRHPEQSRGFFEAAFSQSNVGVSVIDATGRVLEINDAFCRMIGLPRGEIIGRPSSHYTHPDDRARSAGILSGAALGTTGASALEKRYQRPDGSILWARVNLSVAERDAAGQPSRMIGLIEDITASKAAAEAARSSEARLRQVFESVEDYAIFSLDVQGAVTGWNAGAERLFGYKEAEIVGRNSELLWEEADQRQGIPAKERHDAQTLGRGHEEGWRRRKDGSRFFASGILTPIRDAAGALVGFTKVCRDVTARRETENALVAARARLDAALIAGEVGTFTWEIPENRIYGDINFGHMFNVTLGPDGTAPVEAYLAAVHEADRSRVQAALERAMATGTNYQAAFRSQTANGERWIVGRGKYERDASGQVVRLTGVALDVTERRRAEEAQQATLREYERQSRVFDTVLSNTSDFVYLIDREGRFQYANVRLQELFNRTPDQLLGKNFLELDYEPWHAEMHMREVAEVFATKQTVRGEVSYRGPTGIEATFAYVFRPVIGTEGEVEIISGTSYDITESRRNRLALEASEGRFRFLSEIGELTRLLHDPEQIMSTVARTLGSHLGVSRCAYADVEGDAEHFTIRRDYTDGGASLVGQYELSRFGPRTAEALRRGETLVLHDVPRELPEGDAEAFRACGVQATVWSPLVKEGRLVAMMAVHQHGPRQWSDEVIGLIKAVAERSWASIERARNALALARRERQLSFIIEAAQLGTFDWELPASTGKVQWNDRMKSFFWLAPDSPLAGLAAIETLIHPDDRERVQVALVQAIQGNSRYDLEYRIVGPQGQIRWVHASGRSYEDGSGEAKRFSGVVADVTVSRLAAEGREQLLASERAARAEAERTSRMKDEFLATLSHELRTPLNAILGWAQVLRSEPPGPADLEQGLSTIERNARAQTQIIEDLLDMSRIISGKVRLDVMRIDLGSVLEQSIETVRPAAAAKGIRVLPMLDRGVGPVSGDPNRLQQVFWNLLSNAIKFTPRNGRVQVLLERINSHLEISFIDSGEGIQPEFLPHVFDRFRQQDASTTRQHGGLGLGLAIVRQLVELHGGTVTAHSAGAGRGATFRVLLPLVVIHPDQEPERRHPQADFAALSVPDASIRLDGVTVVVVDDEPDARGLVKRLLEDRHAHVLTAGGAAEALELVQRIKPDVLVSDIGMPGEDGYSLIRRVRTLNPQAGGLTPAVALTAYARAEDRMKAILAGFQMHVSKPVEAAELLTMVASLAGKT